MIYLALGTQGYRVGFTCVWESALENCMALRLLVLSAFVVLIPGIFIFKKSTTMWAWDCDPGRCAEDFGVWDVSLR